MNMRASSHTPAEIPVVIVGCGAISRFFYASALAALAEPEALRVVALVDPSEENVRHVAEVFPTARKFRSIEEAEIGSSHLVIVASPPRFHAHQSIHALERGAAVLCEKPMAASLEDAEAMAVAAEDGILAVGLYRRFFPACEAIRGIVQKQTLGRLKSFVVHEGGPFSWQAASESFFRRAATPGGVLFDTGVHTLDLLLWWLGEPDGFVYKDDAMGGLEANCRLALEYADGCRGEVRLSRDWKTENRYTFFFERGMVRWTVNEANKLDISIDGMPATLRGDLVNVSETAGRMFNDGHARTNPQSFIEQIRNVAATMRGQETLRVPAAEGIRSLRLIEQCYRERKLMEMPWLTPAEAAEARRMALAESAEVVVR